LCCAVPWSQAATSASSAPAGSRSACLACMLLSSAVSSSSYQVFWRQAGYLTHERRSVMGHGGRMMRAADSPLSQPGLPGCAPLDFSLSVRSSQRHPSDPQAALQPPSSPSPSSST
jgi:hypothetical protein